MSQSNPSDHWDLLASKLGAESAPAEPEKEPVAADDPPEAACQPEPAPPKEPQEPAETKCPPRASAPSPRPAVADWDALASSLGIPVAPPAAEVELPSSRRDSQKPAATKSIEPESDKPVDEVKRSRSPKSIAADAEEDPKPVDFEIEEPTAKLLEGPAARAELADLSEQSPGADATANDASDESEDEASNKKPSRRRRRRRRKPREADAKSEATPADDTTDAAVEGPEAVEAETSVSEPVESEKADAAEAESEAADAEYPEKGRSKRRRRRSSGRKKKEKDNEAVAEDVSAKAKPAKPSTATEKETSKKDRATKISGDSVAREEEDKQHESEETTKSSRAVHRAIPTWEEAVGLIVATNLESRAKKPSGSSRGRGRGRGSSRGQR